MDELAAEVAALQAENGALRAENERLRTALVPFAHQALPGDSRKSDRERSIRVTEGQVAEAWFVLNEEEAMSPND